MHMRIDADPILIMADSQDEIGCFAADPRKCQQLLHRLRDPPPMPLQQEAADLPHVPRLGPVEPNRIDQPFNFLGAQPGKCCRRGGLSQQASARRFGHRRGRLHPGGAGGALRPPHDRPRGADRRAVRRGGRCPGRRHLGRLPGPDAPGVVAVLGGVLQTGSAGTPTGGAGRT